MNIIPAILPKNRDELITGLQRLINAGYSGRIQVDLCDGVFVPSITWPFSEYQNNVDFLENAHQFSVDSELESLLKNFTIDYDLMVSQSEYLFSVWNVLQPNNIIIHLDSITDHESLAIELLSKKSPFPFVLEKRIVLAISQQTNLDDFAVWYDELGIRNVQVMGIETIGKQGESFSEKTVTIIEQLQKKYTDLVISVDGGVNQQSISKLAKIGIDSVVAGSAVFNGDISENIQSLEKSAII